MRNYPVLKNKEKAETPRNWQHTYVNSLSMQIKSLVDYSNYFLADYRRGPNFIQLDPFITEQGEELPCFSIENLKYHQYRDTDIEGYYFLKSSDWQDHSLSPTSQGAKLISAGRHILNNNQKESNLDSYKDWDNIVIQPIGYTAFYLMTFDKGKFNFNYTRNAELYYGEDQSISPMNFYTRFFYRKNFVLINSNQPFVKIPAENYQDLSPEADWGIQDKQDFIWTDTINNPVMGFVYQKASDLSLGEEVIIDAKITYSVEVDKTSSAIYTIKAEGIAGSQSDRFYPQNSVLYFL